jgi:hypothetical protein
LFFRTSEVTGKTTNTLQFELPLDEVRHVFTMGRRTEIEVKGGALSVQSVGGSAEKRRPVLNALGTETTPPVSFEEFDRSVVEAWQRFPDLPGSQMAVRRVSWGSRELVTADGKVLCTAHGGGRQLVLRERRFIACRGGKPLGIWSGWNPPFDLTDASSGQQVLTLQSRNFDFAASGIALLAPHRYTFPVRSTWTGRSSRRRPQSDFSLMSAVDENGKTVARYRRTRLTGLRWRVEIAVPPEEALSDGLILLVTSTANFLASYFEHPGGGG